LPDALPSEPVSDATAQASWPASSSTRSSRVSERVNSSTGALSMKRNGSQRATAPTGPSKLSGIR